MQELKTSLGRTYLTIDTDVANQWIAVNWQGYLTADSIKEGARAYTEALAKSGFACVLNDTRAVRAPGTTAWTGSSTSGLRMPLPPA